ncbi:MAG: cyclic nucleotide-binding domain-containing protein [Chloroflexi bacterium]|nr:cyclic nucleotide-binding domain-containing protein [Chloroflexota bacterium]
MMANVAVMTDTHELLQRVFPELHDDDIYALNSAAVPCTFPAGVDICHEGELGDTLYIIGKGETDILVHAADDQEIVVDRIGANAYFGEMALLAKTTRSATIRTHTDCQMLEISHHAFLSIANANPDLLRRLLRQIIGHLRRNDRAVIQELNIKHAALQEAYADLAEQEQLRTQFITTLSHELRTPLTSVQGYLELINRGALQNNTLNVAMGSITRNVETMVTLTNQMMLLYELFPAVPEYAMVNVPDMVIEALKAARALDRDEGTAVQLKFGAAIQSVYADKRALLLATRAILENAFKYNPNSASITVTISQLNEKEVAIKVTDEGIGIPQWAQERIFEPFYRIEREGGSNLFPGIGVGLTIAHMVISRHNGRIEVNSTPNQGSTFTIVLPVRA